MTNKHKNIAVTLITVFVMGALLSGCGRRGALEAPPGERIVTTDNKGNTIEKAAPVPDKPFILDGLL